MIKHILVPLDGSTLAECVLPQVLTIAQAFDAHITLLHVVTSPNEGTGRQAIDTVDWLLRKQEAKAYLQHLSSQLKNANFQVDHTILEGAAALSVVDFANHTNVDLIALSTHGHSGLSRWNISSVVEKIIWRSCKSILLVRAYQACMPDLSKTHYKRLFIGLDCSTRAEYSLPTAVRLAQFYKAQLISGTIVQKPKWIGRFQPTNDEAEVIAHIADWNYRMACQYSEQLHSQFSLLGIDLQSRIVISNNLTASLHDMVAQENPDLVILAAHGHSGEQRWPYGSIATSFINYGNTALMIIQDLSDHEIQQTEAEMSALQTRGH